MSKLLARRHRPDAPTAPREAFVLSGGGSLGAAQVGPLRALLEAGVRPDLIVGCSVGALNGAALACQPTLDRVEEMERQWRLVTAKDVFGGSRPTSVAAHVVRRHDHLYEPLALQALIRRWVPVADLALTAVPMHAVTTDLRSGRATWWSCGDPVGVLSASACLPAVFPPVALGESLHVDGGVTCPVPVGRAVELGATRVWVVDVSGGSVGRTDARMTALDVLLRSFAISRAHLADPVPGPEAACRVVRLPRIDVRGLEMRDFSRTAQLIATSYAAAAPAVDAELGRVAALVG